MGGKNLQLGALWTYALYVPSCADVQMNKFSNFKSKIHFQSGYYVNQANSFFFHLFINMYGKKE